MPLKKLCGRASCNQIVDIGITYCDKHQEEFEKSQKERHKEYKQQRIDKREQAFYSSDPWIQTRDYIIDLHLKLTPVLH
jgi:5-methylcytosine-specific restriction enzyme A